MPERFLFFCSVYGSFHLVKVLMLMLAVYRYKDALVLLLREVLNRIQFRLNQSQLEELDDETLDDDVR